MPTQPWVCRLSAELAAAIGIRLALCIPRCGCRTPCLVALVCVAVAVGTVVPRAVYSVFIAVMPRQLREYPSPMCPNTLSFRGPCWSTISWSGSRVSMASRSCSLALRSLRTHLDCSLLLVQVVGHFCLRDGGSARRLLSRRVLSSERGGPHASSYFQRSRKGWT